MGKGKARVMNINGGTGSLAIICRNQKKPEKKGVNYNHKKPLLDCPIGRSFKKKIKDLSFEPSALIGGKFIFSKKSFTRFALQSECSNFNQ